MKTSEEIAEEYVSAFPPDGPRGSKMLAVIIHQAREEMREECAQQILANGGYGIRIVETAVLAKMIRSIEIK